MVLWPKLNHYQCKSTCVKYFNAMIIFYTASSLPFIPIEQQSSNPIRFSDFSKAERKIIVQYNYNHNRC